MRGLASNARAKNRILHCRPRRVAAPCVPSSRCQRPTLACSNEPRRPVVFRNTQTRAPAPVSHVAWSRSAIRHPCADLRRRPLRAGRVGVDCRAGRVHCCACAVRTPAFRSSLPAAGVSTVPLRRAAAAACAQAIGLREGGETMPRMRDGGGEASLARRLRWCGRGPFCENRGVDCVYAHLRRQYLRGMRVSWAQVLDLGICAIGGCTSRAGPGRRRHAIAMPAFAQPLQQPHLLAQSG